MSEIDEYETLLAQLQALNAKHAKIEKALQELAKNDE